MGNGWLRDLSRANGEPRIRSPWLGGFSKVGCVGRSKSPKAKKRFEGCRNGERPFVPVGHGQVRRWRTSQRGSKGALALALAFAARGCAADDGTEIARWLDGKPPGPGAAPTASRPAIWRLGMIYGDMRGVEGNVMRRWCSGPTLFGHSLVVTREACRRVSALVSLTLVREVPRKASRAVRLRYGLDEHQDGRAYLSGGGQGTRHALQAAENKANCGLWTGNGQTAAIHSLPCSDERKNCVGGTWVDARCFYRRQELERAISSPCHKARPHGPL